MLCSSFNAAPNISSGTDEQQISCQWFHGLYRNDTDSLVEDPAPDDQAAYLVVFLVVLEHT